MSRYQFTPQAIDDLLEIWAYVARDNATAADRLEDAIYRACSLLADSPLRGHIRNDLTTRTLRFWTIQQYRNYIVVYDPETTPLQIVRILHGARNFTALL